MHLKEPYIQNSHCHYYKIEIYTRNPMNTILQVPLKTIFSIRECVYQFGTKSEGSLTHSAIN